MPYLDFLCSIPAHKLHKLSLASPSSPTAPSLYFLLSLTLTQWTISVVGGFYLCSQAGYRHGEGCSVPENYVLVRAYASERPLLRPATRKPFPRPQTRSETRVLIGYQLTAAQFSGCLRENRSCLAQTLLHMHIHRHTEAETSVLICHLDVILQQIHQRLKAKQDLLCECVCDT